MADIRGKLYTLYSLEQLSAGRSALHALHPLGKLLATFVYILCVVSFDRHAFFRLAPYVFYPVVLMAAGDIPFGMIGRRTLVALPFCLLAGLSNLLLERAPLFTVGALSVSYGTVSLAALVLRTLLCVSAVLILIALTPFAALGAQLRRFLPDVFVSLLEMIYRYSGALVGEAGNMYTAYQLRGAGRGVALGDMGSFTGQLLLRSFARAERVYAAMQCRGYPAPTSKTAGRFQAADYGFLGGVCAFCLLFRFFDIPGALARCLEGLL